MKKSNNDETKVTLGFSERQSIYLQRLGLKTLLERRFPKSIKTLAIKMWANRIGVAMGCLAVYGITIAAVAQGYKNDLRIQQQILLSHKSTEENSKLSSATDNELLEKIMELTEGDINKKSEDGSTAMHIAFFQGNSTQFIDLLISRGADLNAQKGNGGTPLMTGMHRGAYELVIHVLINHPSKIDLGIKNSRGLNIFDIAVRKHKRDLSDPLLEQILYLTDRE